jgi:hypothetical protein
MRCIREHVKRVSNKLKQCLWRRAGGEAEQQAATAVGLTPRRANPRAPHHQERGAESMLDRVHLPPPRRASLGPSARCALPSFFVVFSAAKLFPCGLCERGTGTGPQQQQQAGTTGYRCNKHGVRGGEKGKTHTHIHAHAC